MTAPERSAAAPGPASACPLSFLPAPFCCSLWGLHLQAGTRGQCLIPAPSARPVAGEQARTATHRLWCAVCCLPRHSNWLARRHSRPSMSVISAAHTVPDSPAQRRGRVSRRQVSPCEKGFMCAPRYPTFLLRVGLPLPLPPLWVLLAAASTLLPGLRHSARGSQQWDGCKAGRLERPPLSRAELRPRCLQPQCPSARLSYRRSHPPGEGSGGLNSSPSAHPLPSSPLPTRSGWRGVAGGPALSPGPPPRAHRVSEAGPRPSRAPQTSSPERGLERDWGPEP